MITLATATSSSIFLFLCLSCLAGCFSPDNSSNFVVDGGCPQSLGSACTETLKSIRIEGIRLDGHDRKGAGLRILNVEKDVILTDVEIRNFDIALLVQQSACQTCRLSIQNGSFSARYESIRIENLAGRVELQSLELRTLGGGTIQKQEVNGTQVVAVMDGTYGLFVASTRLSSLQIRDVQFGASIDSAGDAVSLLDSTIDSFRVSGVSVEHYRNAMLGDFGDIELQNVRIACLESGIIQRTQANRAIQDWTVSATGLQIHGCKEKSLELPFATQVKLTDFEGSGGTSLLHLLNVRLLDMTNFTMADAQYGVAIQADNSGRLKAVFAEGDVHNITYAGIQAKFEQVIVHNVTFTMNGFGWPDPNAESPAGNNWAINYGAIVWQPIGSDPSQTMTIQESSFKGNTPYAVAGTTLLPIDARQNWWGSPSGPRVRPQESTLFEPPPVAIGIGSGDNVTANVLFSPYASQP